MRAARRYLLKSTLSNLIILESVGRLKSFTAAADELNMTQSAVSHAIRKLEGLLDRKLFLRSSANVHTTHEGEELLKCAGRCIDLVDETLGAMASPQHNSGAIVMAMTSSLARHWFLPRFTVASDEVANVKLWLQTLDRQVSLDQENIDCHIAIRATPPVEYDSFPLWPEEVFAVCSPEYYRKHGPFETVADLNRASLIQFDDRSKPSMDWNEWFRLQHGAYKSTDSGLRYSDYSLALDASMKGEGVVMGWAPIIDDLITDKRFVLAFPTSSPGGRKYYLIARKGTFASGPNAVFLRWLQRKAVTP